MKNTTTKTTPKAPNQKGIKAARDVVAANLARIDAAERGEKSPATPAVEVVAAGSPKPKKGGTKKASAAKASKPAKEKKAKKMSGLDAAHRVLTEAKQPMNAQDIVKAMADLGYWSSPNGKTPHATIYAAMVREIKERGREARFTKKERGQFAASGRGN